MIVAIADSYIRNTGVGIESLAYQSVASPHYNMGSWYFPSHLCISSGRPPGCRQLGPCSDLPAVLLLSLLDTAGSPVPLMLTAA